MAGGKFTNVTGSSLERLFQSAIAYAENVPGLGGYSESWADPVNHPRIKANPESVRVFLPEARLHSRAICFAIRMARALHLVAEKGPDAVYKGEMGPRF
jgi:gamma-glutamyltranspeptidase